MITFFDKDKKEHIQADQYVSDGQSFMSQFRSQGRSKAGFF